MTRIQTANPLAVSAVASATAIVRGDVAWR